jgi:putative oxidoreductase
MKKFFFDCGTRDATASLGLVALRVMIGSMLLIGHGIPKMQNFSIRKEFFYVPSFLPPSWSPASLVLCIAVEVFTSSLLIIGFATRPAAFLIGVCIIVAAFGALGASPVFQKTSTLIETKELALMYLIPMISIILAGAGSYSFDAIYYRDPKRRRW